MNHRILRRWNVVIAPLLLLLAGCGGRSLNLDRLEEAEALIMERPDSSLSILEKINRDQLKEGREKALYGLLYTMALAKNHLKPKDDSLILYSSDYFTRKGDIENQIKSDYYRGKVLYHRQEFPKALISYFKAKEAGEHYRDQIFWAGMACRGISDIYLELYSFKDNLFYASTCYRYIKESQTQPYLNYALHDMGSAYYNNGHCEESLKIVEETLDSALKFDDKYLYHESLHLKGLNYHYQGRYIDSKEIFKELSESEYAQAKDSLYLCMSLVELKEINEAKRLVKKISNTDRPHKNLIQYKIYMSEGKEHEALIEMVNLYNESNRLIGNSLNKYQAKDLADYFELNKALDTERINSQILKNKVIIFISIFIFLCLILVIITLRVKYKKEISKKQLFVNELEDIINKSEREKSTATALIKEMFGSRFYILKESGEIFYRYNDTQKARKHIGDLVARMIEELGINGNKLNLLEEEINKTYDNIMIDFRYSFPELKEKDYAIFMYSILGFPASMISLLLKEGKIESIYNRKKYLKTRIKKHEQKDKFLIYL